MNWARFSFWTTLLASIFAFLALIAEYVEVGKLNYIYVFLTIIFLAVAILHKKIFPQK